MKLRLAVLFLAIASIPLHFVSAITFTHYRNSLDSARLSNLRDIAAFKADKIETQERDIAWKIGDLPDIYGDPSLLRLVLVNLLSNALKFTRTRPRAEIEIGCTEEEDEFFFFIKDNGVGFDMDYAEKLFCVSQRLHHRCEFEGTGIGLANVRRIVSRHGGRAWAAGSPDQGATFYFSLPKARKA